ncbi:MAG: membrane protein insertase YidC [Steroidobacteraceae bacterium]
MRALALLLALLPAGAAAESVWLDGERQRIEIGLQGGLPLGFVSCADACPAALPVTAAPGHRWLLRAGPGGGALRFVVPGDPAATAAINRLEYEAEVLQDATRISVVLSARTPATEAPLVQRYDMDRRARTLTATLQLPPGARLQLIGGSDLVPEEFPGFGGIYSNARAVIVGAGGQKTIADAGDDPVVDRELAAGDWAGVRGRFWTLLLRADRALLVDAVESAGDAPELSWRAAAPTEGTLRWTLYGGPVAKGDLEEAAPELPNMLYAVLWTPLRWLSFGLQWILDRWQDLVGVAWLAILLLSLTVKLLMAPLIMVAERWQADVNRTRSLLEPELAAIRREFRGEEAHNRTLAVYRQHGVSHFYTFRSLAGFMIQIPVFIAAFDMLGENFRLGGEGFLWIADLSAPDRFMALPAVLPFFGGHLNLLPIVMTLLTVLAARLQEDASLAPALRRGQRLRLYAMAGVFLVLLYTFPAGMVLYWTANNFWHLLRVFWERARSKGAGA